MRKTWMIIGIITLFFIFGQSLIPGHLSAEQSGFFTQRFQAILTLFGIQMELSLLSVLVRKTAHAVEFFILGLSWTFYIVSTPLKRKITFLVFLGIISATLDETLQFFVPGRHASFWDVLLDVSFYGLGGWLAFLWISKSDKKKGSPREPLR